MTSGADEEHRVLFSIEEWGSYAGIVGCNRQPVNPNPQKRSHGEKERWVLEGFLLTSEAGDFLELPLSVLGGDRPDFILQERSRLIGVEIAEVTSQLTARSNTRRHELGLELAHIPKSGDFTRAKPSQAELDRALRIGGSPWIGDAPEREFSELACDIILKKKQKWAGYVGTSVRLLLLYNNSGLPLSRAPFHASKALGAIEAAACEASVMIDQVAVLGNGAA